jgi:hypothetical protein
MCSELALLLSNPDSTRRYAIFDTTNIGTFWGNYLYRAVGKHRNRQRRARGSLQREVDSPTVARNALVC